VGRSLTDLAWQAWFWPVTGIPNTGRFMLHMTELWVALSTLLIRFWVWVLALPTGEPTFDPVAVTLAWSLALWAVAVWAGWALRRLEHPLLALTPAGALVATTLTYTLHKMGPLPIILLITLLLMGLVGQQVRERRWQVALIDYAPSHVELAMAIIPISVVLMVTAGMISSTSIKKIVQLTHQLFAGRTVQVEPVVNSLGLRQQSNQPLTRNEIRLPGMPRRHLLGSGPELSEQVAMVISTGELFGDPSAGEPDRPAPRYYWRSLTYDYYSGRGWSTGKTKQMTYDTGELAISTTSPARRVLHQEVEVFNHQNSLLYAAGDLVMANHSFSVDWRGPGDPFGGSIDANTYQVDSLVLAASETELRATGRNYPDWVVQRYLDLPRQTPERVLILARDLTATAPTPYDQAKAIEAYLRTFPYSLDLPKPPTDQDVVDYFLFDLQQGYCDYYATSMVVLARAAGLPARLAIGYASGIYDTANARYVVTEADAHSWAEIYFPDYGWVEFEPTAAREVPERSAETTLPDIPESWSEGRSLVAIQPDRLVQRWGWLLPGGLALLIIGGLAWSVVDGWRLRRLAPAITVATLYQRLQHHGQRLAVPTWAGDTPYEFAVSLSERFNTLAQEKRWQTALAPANQELRWLTNLYVRTTYSAHRPHSAEQAQAIQTWQRLRKRLWLVWIRASLAKLRNSS
jgi:transglutaminase-like putative cysteine protease